MGPLVQQAQKDGALNDPTVAAIVNDAVNQINTLNTGVMNSLITPYQGSVPPPNVIQHMSQNVADSIRGTSGNSSNICLTGGGNADNVALKCN